MNKLKTILSLCDYTGNWSQPYREAGYNVIQVDLQHGSDVRLLKYPGRVHGVLAAPPCDHFANVGARWWAGWGEAELMEALALVDACLRPVVAGKPKWWVLENPKGRLRDYLGPPQMKIQPHEYGDPYSKETWLWGDFTPPFKQPVEFDITQEPGRPGSRDRTSKLSSSAKNKRAATPLGFAYAFYNANP